MLDRSLVECGVLSDVTYWNIGYCKAIAITEQLCYAKNLSLRCESGFFEAIVFIPLSYSRNPGFNMRPNQFTELLGF